MKFLIKNKATGATIGTFEASDADRAVDAMAHNLSYDNFRTLCSAINPANVETEMARRRADLVIEAVK